VNKWGVNAYSPAVMERILKIEPSIEFSKKHKASAQG
jgi:hypothetical protein